VNFPDGGLLPQRGGGIKRLPAQFPVFLAGNA